MGTKVSFESREKIVDGMDILYSRKNPYLAQKSQNSYSRLSAKDISGFVKNVCQGSG
jgi:hypothetical protein